MLSSSVGGAGDFPPEPPRRPRAPEAPLALLIERLRTLRDRVRPDGAALAAHEKEALDEVIAVMQEVMQTLGPTAPTCDGCAEEVTYALRALMNAGIEYQKPLNAMHARADETVKD